MAISRGESPLRSRWLPILLVASLVLNGAVLGRPSGQPAVCGRSCCAVLPSCADAKRVTCDCPEQDKMTLRKGDIPATAHSVTIRNMQHLILEEDVIGDLPSLVNFTVSDVGQLEIRRDGMASHNQTRLRSVLFQNVQSLQAESHSFSGVWQSETTIRMHHIENLNVMPNGFSYQASITGPSVSLQHVNSLNLESSGFSAPMFSMSLTNVTMDDCQEHSFGGSAYYTEWNTVKVKEMRAKCFHGQNALGSFTINSLSVENTHPGSFYGDVQELRVENSHLGTIQRESFNLTVSSMEISKSSIGELHSEGLKVLARESFKLDVIRVNQLRKDAFLGVQMVRSADGFSPAFKIRKMEVMEAENGSLTFSPCTEVRISELDVTAPLPPICPTERWTRALSAGGMDGQLSQAQYELFFILLDRRWCTEDGWTPFPDSADNPQCQPTGQETGDDTPGGGTGDPDTAQDTKGGIEQQDSNKDGKKDKEDVKADEDIASRLADGGAPAKDDDDDKMAYYSWDEELTSVEDASQEAVGDESNGQKDIRPAQTSICRGQPCSGGTEGIGGSSGSGGTEGIEGGSGSGGTGNVIGDIAGTATAAGNAVIARTADNAVNEGIVGTTDDESSIGSSSPSSGSSAQDRKSTTGRMSVTKDDTDGQKERVALKTDKPVVEIFMNRRAARVKLSSGDASVVASFAFDQDEIQPEEMSSSGSDDSIDSDFLRRLLSLQEPALVAPERRVPVSNTLKFLRKSVKGVSSAGSLPSQTPLPSAASPGSADASSGSLDASHGSLDASSGSSDASRGSLDASIGSADASSGSLDASSGSADASSGSLDASSGSADASSGSSDVSSGSLDGWLTSHLHVLQYVLLGAALMLMAGLMLSLLLLLLLRQQRFGHGHRRNYDVERGDDLQYVHIMDGKANVKASLLPPAHFASGIHAKNGIV